MEKQKFPIPGQFSEEEATRIERKIYRLIDEVKEQHEDLPESDLEVNLHAVGSLRPTITPRMEATTIMVIIMVAVGNPFSVAFLKRMGENVADYLSRKLGIKQ